MHKMNISEKLLNTVHKEMVDRYYPNGNRYYGQFKDGKPHGMGVLVYANGDKYTGSFKEGDLHGKGRIKYQENGTTYDGLWENNQRHSYGTIVDKRVGTYIGDWKFGDVHGRGILKCKNGDYYSGEFKNSLYHGKGSLFLADGVKYIGVFEYGKYHGFGTEIFGPYHLNIGEYREGVRQGTGFALNDDSSMYFGEFKNGECDGHGIEIERYDNIYHGEFKKGKYCGDGRYIDVIAGDYINETIGIYKDSKLNGNATTYYHDGSRLSGKYKDNVCNGNVTTHYPDGKYRTGWMAENILSMDFQGFLRSETLDTNGRYLTDIWNFSDEQIEFTHDFISLIFPLDCQSNNAAQYFYLRNKDLIKVMRADILIKTNLIKSAEWFLAYLVRNPAWQSKYNHNQFRITRIIRSLRLLVTDKVADKFYQDILNLLDENHIVNEKSLAFWAGA